MKRLIAFVGLGLLTACAEPASVGMNIVKGTATEYLVGGFRGSMGDNSRFEVSDGSLTCIGEATSSEMTMGWSQGTFKYTFAMKCSDGRTGTALVSITETQYSSSGVGTGSLSDGAKLRITIGGSQSGQLVW